jgi:hypothetical protein
MIALLFLLAAAPEAQAPTPASLGDRATQSFAQGCLANRTAGAEAAIAAIQALPGVAEQPSLPIGNKKLLPFVAGDLEYLVRPEKRGFGCFVAFKGGVQEAGMAVTAIGKLGGLTSRTPKAKGKPSYEWTIDGTKDHVRLVPGSDLGGVLINLEATGN